MMREFCPFWHPVLQEKYTYQVLDILILFAQRQWL